MRPGEIVGIAGVSGNGQRELVEALVGQRPPRAGGVALDGRPYRATRRAIRAHGAFSLPEEPLRNACVPAMSVAENMALPELRRAAARRARPWLRRGAVRAQARAAGSPRSG